MIETIHYRRFVVRAIRTIPREMIINATSRSSRSRGMRGRGSRVSSRGSDNNTRYNKTSTDGERERENGGARELVTNAPPHKELAARPSEEWSDAYMAFGRNSSLPTRKRVRQNHTRVYEAYPPAFRAASCRVAPRRAASRDINAHFSENNAVF